MIFKRGDKVLIFSAITFGKVLGRGVVLGAADDGHYFVKNDKGITLQDSPEFLKLTAVSA